MIKTLIKNDITIATSFHKRLSQGISKGTDPPFYSIRENVLKTEFKIVNY